MSEVKNEKKGKRVVFRRTKEGERWREIARQFSEGEIGVGARLIYALDEATTLREMFTMQRRAEVFVTPELPTPNERALAACFLAAMADSQEPIR